MTTTTTKQKVGAGAAISAAVLLVATPFIGKWEGTRTTPYKDVIGVMTVCTGETRVAMRKYTVAECSDMLNKAIAHQYGPAVLKCTPVLIEHPNELAAAISLTYNIGTGAYCKSSIARNFNAGRITAACNGFPAWNRAGGRVINGLTLRRKDEQKLCLTPEGVK